MKLYELSSAMTQVIELMENGAEGLEDTLEALNLSFDEKVDNCVKMHRNLLAQAELCKAEAKRLSDRARAWEKQAEFLKRYTELEMRKMGVEEVKSSLFKIKLALNPPSVNVVDEELIPMDFYTVPEPSISKSAILDALKKGIEVPGAELKQEKSLRIG
jgi:hypothetical protein